MTETRDVAETKVRTVRVDDELWRLAQAVAGRRRETVAQVLKSALVEYTEQHATEAEREAARSPQPVDVSTRGGI